MLALEIIVGVIAWVVFVYWLCGVFRLNKKYEEMDMWEDEE